MTDLRNHPEWRLMVQMREAGYPIDKVAAFFELSEYDLRRAFGSWTAVERIRPKVAKDGTTVCPRCGNEAWPVIYGMWVPDPDNPEPKAVMAGCLVGGDDPDWNCTHDDCGYEWRVQLDD